MKRSRNVNLQFMRKSVAVNVVMSGTLLLSGCSSTQDAAFYRSIQECVSDNSGYERECTQAYYLAKVEAERTAPSYSTLRDCEYEFGNCDQTTENLFIPALAGFMLAGAAADSFDYDDPEPLFHYKKSYYGSKGYRYGSSLGSKFKVPKESFVPKTASTKTLSRGGFGSMVVSKSNYSGSSSFGGRSTFGG